MLSEKDCGNTVLGQWQAERVEILKQLEQNEGAITSLQREKEAEIQQLKQEHKLELSQLKVKRK